MSALDLCFSKCGPWTSIISTTWNLVRNTKFYGFTEDNWYRTSNTSPSILCLQISASDSDAKLSWNQDCQSHGFCFFFTSLWLFFFSNQCSKVKTTVWKENVMGKIGKYFFFHFFLIFTCLRCWQKLSSLKMKTVHFITIYIVQFFYKCLQKWFNLYLFFNHDKLGNYVLLSWFQT